MGLTSRTDPKPRPVSAKDNLGEVVLELPLLLAGPILRRVETTLATVWIALSEAATVGGTTQNLKSLHMLGAETVDGSAHVPLGYGAGRLPTFAPPPSQLADLRILYGSCRRPNFDGNLPLA
jgi:hypothetical protein